MILFTGERCDAPAPRGVCTEKKRAILFTTNKQFFFSFFSLNNRSPISLLFFYKVERQESLKVVFSSHRSFVFKPVFVEFVLQI